MHDVFDGARGDDAARFCNAVAFTDAGAVRQIPGGQCEKAFSAGVVGVGFGVYYRLRSVASVRVSGDRARARVAVHLVGTKKNPSFVVELVKSDRWRMLMPCDLIGCDASLLPPKHRKRRHPKTLDVRRGEYAGVRIGISRRTARRIAGPLPKQPHNFSAGPLGNDFYDDGGPSTWNPPGSGGPLGRDLRYRNVAFLVTDGSRRRIYGFIITDRRAQTARGVGFGDTLAYARKLYPRLHCDVINQYSEYATFPSCRVRVAPHRYLGFAQNPIRTITLMTVPFDDTR